MRSGFSQGHLYQCSLFAPIDHSSPQNLTTLHAYYQLESAPAGSRLHAVADEGVSVREIAGVIGRRLDVPVVSVPVEEAGEHFGFLGNFFSVDSTASSTLTQQHLGWHPVQPGLLADLDQEYYFKNER